MSTRSLTIVHSRWPGHEWERRAVIFRHWDGYPSGHGQWLYDELKDISIINGKGDNLPAKWVNGPGRLAGYLVYRLWEDGHEPSLSIDVGDQWQEFEYHVYVDFGPHGKDFPIHIEVVSAYTSDGVQPIFSGTIENFGKFVTSYRKEDNDE